MGGDDYKSSTLYIAVNSFIILCGWAYCCIWLYKEQMYFSEIMSYGLAPTWDVIIQESIIILLISLFVLAVPVAILSILWEYYKPIKQEVKKEREML